jgi:putative membrane protein
MFYLYRWLALSLTILMIPSLVSGVHVATFSAALAAAAVLSVLNILVKPLLIVLTLPLTLLSFGGFLIVINALIFQFASQLVSGVAVDSFGSAILASLIVSVVAWFVNSIGEPRAPLRFSFSQRKGPRKEAPSKKDPLEMHQTSDGRWE